MRERHKHGCRQLVQAGARASQQAGGGEAGGPRVLSPGPGGTVSLCPSGLEHC